jgi:hypothetical protein
MKNFITRLDEMPQQFYERERESKLALGDFFIPKSLKSVLSMPEKKKV